MKPIIVGGEREPWLHKWLSDMIMEHLGRTGQHSEDFSGEAVGNRRFMKQFRDGGSNPRLDTIQAIIYYIEVRRPADQLELLS